MDSKRLRNHQILVNRIIIMTSPNWNRSRVTGPFCGEFTGHRWLPLAKASDAEHWCFLWSAPSKRLSKQSWGWWFETPSRPLWRHCNAWSGPLYVNRCVTLRLSFQLEDGSHLRSNALPPLSPNPNSPRQYKVSMGVYASYDDVSNE